MSPQPKDPEEPYVTKAYVQRRDDLLAVNMTIARMSKEHLFQPEFIMRFGGEYPHVHEWGPVQENVHTEPTFSFRDDEARALYEALAEFYGEKPAGIIHFNVSTPLTAAQVEEFRDRFQQDIKKGHWSFNEEPNRSNDEPA